jgi:glycosyltransferase involved in cell wall biosynthesis
MAVGLPVIVSDQVGIHGDIAAAGAGLVVPCETDQLARALIALLEDSETRRSMGDRGRLFARQHYSSAVVTRQLIDVYNRVIH